jgi:hypothetical protein
LAAFLRFSGFLKWIPIGAAELEAAFLWVRIFGRIAAAVLANRDNWNKESNPDPASLL